MSDYKEKTIRLMAQEGGRLLSEVERLQDENRGLRELVRDMMRFFEDGDYCTICEKFTECESPDEYGSDCLMRGVFRSRMAELGVEVDE